MAYNFIKCLIDKTNAKRVTYCNNLTRLIEWYFIGKSYRTKTCNRTLIKNYKMYTLDFSMAIGQ